MSEQNSTQDYSKAFEVFAESDIADELVGLVAYALYKKQIRERVQRGDVVASAQRNPTKSEQQIYISAAEDALDKFAVSIIDNARDQIVHENTQAEIYQVKMEVIESIETRTSLRTAIGANLVAWLISIGITVLLLVFLSSPNLIDVIFDAG